MKLVKKLVIVVLIFSLVASMSTIFASANTVAYGAATVNTASLRLRTGPGLGHNVDMLLSQGDIVVILERTTDEWYHVNFHGNVGFVSVPLLMDILTIENFNAQGRITGNSVNIRARPTTTSDILATHTRGTTMTVIGINEGWYKVQHGGHTGYIRSDLMEIVAGQRAATASAQSVQVISDAPVPLADLEMGQQLVDFALGFVGTRYLWGGMSPDGFDCSGLVSYVYRNFGISVTRNASGQYRDNGVHVPRSDLAPGDLVFFSSNGRSVTHVGIYIGDNEFVHASRSGIGVVISRLDSSYYRNVWFGAKRLIYD